MQIPNHLKWSETSKTKFDGYEFDERLIMQPKRARKLSMKTMEKLLLSTDLNSEEIKNFESAKEENKGALFLDELEKVN